MTTFDGKDSQDVNTSISDTLIYGNGGDDVLVAVNEDESTQMFGGDGNDSLALSIDFKAPSGEIHGDDGDDFIVGGFFDDTLYGGEGNDMIFGARGHDTIYGGRGSDKIYGFIKPADKPDSADDLFGDAGKDHIRGSAGADKIHGGSGSDTLTGNSGSDTFYFETKLDADKNVDKITDFDAGKDTLALSDKIFDVGASGALDPDLFHVGKKAADADDRIIYDPKSGALIYDSNGSGKGHDVEFAHLDKHLDLNASDFLIF
jgi:Ca2+-binding RTX toxin-like protein